MKKCVKILTQSYSTPEIEVIEIVSEGAFLSASATGEWEEDNDSFNF